MCKAYQLGSMPDFSLEGKAGFGTTPKNSEDSNDLYTARLFVGQHSCTHMLR